MNWFRVSKEHYVLFWIYILILNMFRCLRSEFRLINRSSTHVPNAGVMCSCRMSCIISATQSTEPDEPQTVEPEVKPAEGSSWCVCVCVYVCVCSQLAQTPSHSLLFSKQIWPHGNPSPASVHVVSSSTIALNVFFTMLVAVAYKLFTKIRRWKCWLFWHVKCVLT